MSYPILDDQKLDRRIDALFRGEGGARRLDTWEIANELDLAPAEVAARLARFRDRLARQRKAAA